MPIYVYRCKRCDREIEEIVFNKDKEFKCNNCGTTMKRMPTFANFTVNGFNYKNGYSNEGENEKCKK